MSNTINAIETLIEDVESFGKTTLELAKLKAIAQYADTASTLVSHVVIIAIAGVFTTMISVAIALCIGDFLGKASYGFFCVAFFYAFVMMLLYIFKKQWLKTPVSNAIISKIQA
jgi:hypothetical protein